MCLYYKTVCGQCKRIKLQREAYCSGYKIEDIKIINKIPDRRFKDSNQITRFVCPFKNPNPLPVSNGIPPYVDCCPPYVDCGNDPNINPDDLIARGMWKSCFKW